MQVARYWRMKEQTYRLQGFKNEHGETSLTKHSDLAAQALTPPSTVDMQATVDIQESTPTQKRRVAAA